MSDVVVEGKVLSFDANKGYGFISPTSGGEDVFFHVNHLTEPGTRVVPGCTVSYVGEIGARGPVAYMVQVLTSAAAKASRVEPSDGDEVLTRQDFIDEVTEVLVTAATDLRAAELREIREALATMAADYGWITP